MSLSKPVLRTSPDPGAPSTPSRLLLTLLNGVSTGALLLSLPAVIPYTIVKHFLFGPRARWMDLRAHLLSNIIRIALLRFSFFLPGRDKSEWDVPRAFRNGCKRAPGVTASMVRLQPTKRREGFAECPAVEAVERPGFMLAPPGIAPEARAAEGEKAILYFVGGAYAFGHPLERPFAWTMASSFGVRVLGPNYRKVLTPSTSFPAPLLDALAGWEYLTETLGFDPENITFIGESAGAHLCLALSRYLADSGRAGPGALALSGPWCDLGPLETVRTSMHSNYGTDYIPWLGKLAARSAARHYTPETRTGPYFSPVRARPKEWEYLADTKVYVHAGEMELLIDEIRVTVANMREGGVELTYVEEKDGVHVSPTMAAIFPTARSWEVWRDDVGPIVRREY